MQRYGSGRCEGQNLSRQAASWNSCGIADEFGLGTAGVRLSETLFIYDFPIRQLYRTVHECFCFLVQRRAGEYHASVSEY